MILDHLQHPSYVTRDRLLLILYEATMANRYQLATLLNCSVHNIDQTIKRLNGSHEQKVVQSLWVPNKGPRMYTLGVVGWEKVMQMMEEDRKYVEKSILQVPHYSGINDILTRIVEEIGYEFSLQNLEWYFTNEASDILKYPWSVAKWKEWQDPKLRWQEEQMMIRPDARLVIDNKAYWIEYDNQTESEKQIKEKYRKYIRTLAKLPDYLGLRNPVVWVAPSKRRVANLNLWWEYVKFEPEFQESVDWIPSMCFFEIGNETEFLIKGFE